MIAELFNKVVDEQLTTCKNVLCSKANEYATEDRLHNFKQAAHIQKTSPTKALAGMMAKHTVSIYDMIESGREYTGAMWDEKITDSINYLLLLKALVYDQQLAIPCDFGEELFCADNQRFNLASH